MKRTPHFALWLIAILFTTTFALSGCGSSIDSSTGEDKPAIAATIHIKDGEFDPREIDIETGGSVMWINDDVSSHDLKFLEPNTLWSGVMELGDAWIHTFATAGTFDYYCDFRNSMKGSVVVRSSS